MRTAVQSKKQDFLHATVGAIIERLHENEWQVLIQTRWKPEEDPKHSGLLEIPCGRIEHGEDIFKALKREIREECGLQIQTIKQRQETISKGRFGEVSVAFVPFCGESFLSSNFIGFVFVCTAKGKLIPKGLHDAKEPRWISLKELQKILSSNPDEFFPYHLSALKLYVKEKEKGNI